jgi:hypothetical protein
VQAVCKKGLYIEAGQVRHYGATAEAIDLYDRALNENRAKKLEIAQEQPQGVSSDIEITGIEIKAPEKPADAEILNSDCVQIQVHYLAYKKIEKANLVVRILRSDGLTCCAMRTGLDNFDLCVEPGKGTVSVNLAPIQLYGGSYYVQAVFKDAADANSFTTGSSDWFYIKGSVLSYQEMNGVFVPNHLWQHNRSS